MSTSEDKLRISKQPEVMCSKIDEYIKNIDRISSDISFALKSEDMDEIKNLCESADWDLSGVNIQFENLRCALEEVRSWGQQWKDVAKNLIEFHEPSLLEEK